ncbi:sensor histidine kinase [Congregicoccus parvus]|uniref:sensor histidine kinase n=1 Tax=Congregicoccus parvus TaxID=3081749 RepID=UPI003FA53562
MPRKTRTLDRVLGRIDNLDPVNLANLVQRLARERTFFEAVFDAIREGVLVVDRDGLIDYANLAAMRMVALKEQDVGRASLWRLVPGLRQSLDLAPGEDLTGRSALSREVELTYPEPRIVRLYIVPFTEDGEDHQEVTPRFAVILGDVTQEVLSTRDRIESEKVSSILLLAAGVAHEIGNPLNSLTIHLQLMQRSLRKSASAAALEKMRSSLEVCQNEVTRLDEIVRNFLEAIRPRPPDLQTVDLVDTLEEVLKVQGQELQDRNLVVEVEASSGAAIVKADRNQVKQVFFNVIKNAMEAMSAGGRLHIKTRANDDAVFIQFGDTGQGIPQDDLPRLFQPFHTTKKGGSGLGLMIIQRIMRDHGGQVGIDSRQGVGTVVTLEFPRNERRVRLLQR